MRIAIPITGGALEQHFGHCEKFALVDVDPGTRQVIASSEVDAPEHQHGVFPAWLKKQNVTLVIAGGIGTHARSLCNELSIDVLTGAPSEAAASLVQQYLRGTLASSDHVCEHH
jgi:ATP-binding protein involved in chromosome partitioning